MANKLNVDLHFDTLKGKAETSCLKRKQFPALSVLSPWAFSSCYSSDVFSCQS